MRRQRAGRSRGTTALCLAVLTVPLVGGTVHVAAGDPVASSARPTGAMSVVAGEPGPQYYEAFPAARDAGWADPNFFPIGVWFQSVLSQDDVDIDRSLGINTYVELTADTDMSLVRRAGMYAITSEPIPGYGSETVGWLAHDEADMWAGSGYANWTGVQPDDGSSPCLPSTEGCGYSVMEDRVAELPSGDGRMLYANFGKGVVMWLDDEEAAPFVNDYTDVLSTDVYWYTDPFVCDELTEYLSIGPDQCRRSANYGINLDRATFLDGLDGKRQPIFADVEVGVPFSEGGSPITGDELRGAVMTSLIHGARGIIYFSHNFGGPCVSYHVLRDRCGEAIRPAVTTLNRQLTELAPVLNSPSLSWSFNPGLSTLVKELNGSYYVFVMLGRDSTPGSYVLDLPDEMRAARAEVLYEGRDLENSAGTVTDTFDAEFTSHIYRFTPSG